MRENYTNQIFGTRKIIKNYCVPEDWESIGKNVPNEISKYRLSECLCCGTKIPVRIPSLQNNPPRRCSFCSNINHQSKQPSLTNHWTTYEEYAVINIPFKENIINGYIDIDDYKKISSFKWRVSQKRNKFYLITGSDKNQIYMHQMVMAQEVPEGYEIDHIDGNSLNNRKQNLRIITKAENARNVKVRIDNKIGIRGVSYSKKQHKYITDFCYNKKRFYFPHWNTIEEAVWCRKIAEDYFHINILASNPLFEQYDTLSEQQKETIYSLITPILNSVKTPV